MAITQELQDKLDYLDENYERWQNLPDDHPDIQELQRLAIKPEKKKPVKKTKRLPQPQWAEEEERFIKRNYKTMTAEEISQSLGKRLEQTKSKIRRMIRNGELKQKRGKTAGQAVEVSWEGGRRAFPSMTQCGYFFDLHPMVIRQLCHEEGSRNGYSFRFVERSAPCGTTEQGNS